MFAGARFEQIRGDQSVEVEVGRPDALRQPNAFGKHLLVEKVLDLMEIPTNHFFMQDGMGKTVCGKISGVGASAGRRGV